MQSEIKTEVLATIDELNQYLNGNVTNIGLQIHLMDLVDKLQMEQQLHENYFYISHNKPIK